MIVTRAERHIIKRSHILYKTIDKLCFDCKNLYNYGNYIIRQEFFTKNDNSTNNDNDAVQEKPRWIRYNELDKICQPSDAYKSMLYSSTAQQTLKMLDKTWKGYFAAIKDYKKNPSKYSGRPKMPGYLDKEKGRYVACFTNQTFNIKDGYIHFKGKKLIEFNNTFATKIPADCKLMQLRFVPKVDYYVMEVVYEQEVSNIDAEQLPLRVISIDLGINNLATVVNNFNAPAFAINGRPLKSLNQYYNKKISDMRQHIKIQYDRDWSNKMQKLTSKRNRKVQDYMHKATAKLIKYCLDNNVDTVICGYHKGMKLDMLTKDKVDNQVFMTIPHRMIIEQLTYKLENHGIRFIQQDEQYSSGTSFLDNEVATENNYDISRRIHRGMFVSNDGVKINADVNSAYQIMKSALPECMKSFNMGCLSLHPIMVNVV